MLFSGELSHSSALFGLRFFIPYIAYTGGDTEVQFPTAVTVKAVIDREAFDEVLVAVGEPVGIGVEGAGAVGYLLIYSAQAKREVHTQVPIQHLIAAQQAEAGIIPRHLKVVVQDDAGAGIVVIVGMCSGVAVVIGWAQPDELPVYSPPLKAPGIIPELGRGPVSPLLLLQEQRGYVPQLGQRTEMPAYALFGR